MEIEQQLLPVWIQLGDYQNIARVVGCTCEYAGMVVRGVRAGNSVKATQVLELAQKLAALNHQKSTVLSEYKKALSHNK